MYYFKHRGRCKSTSEHRTNMISRLHSTCRNEKCNEVSRGSNRIILKQMEVYNLCNTVDSKADTLETREIVRFRYFVFVRVQLATVPGLLSAI